MKISVITPTWNRSRYLIRVWESLEKQSYKNFEWIIADDGSIDDTEKKVYEIEALSTFSIIYIKSDRRIGKASIDNEAIKAASGDFILWCDSDDYLLPNTLDRLIETWLSIPVAECDHYVGVTAFCIADNGVLENLHPEISSFDSSWNDLVKVHGVAGDMLFFVRACALKACPFPEVDYVIPESVVWTAIGNKKSRTILEILKIIEYKSPNCISYSGKMEYNRGYAYAVAITNNNLRHYPQSMGNKMWYIINFIRYCIHGDINFVTAFRLLGNNSIWFLFFVLIPFGWMLAKKDSLQKKVVKSHRNFLLDREKASIDIKRFLKK